MRCKNCGERLNGNPDACPSCGAPAERLSSVTKLVLCLVFVVLIFLTLFLYTGFSKNRGLVTSTPEPVHVYVIASPSPSPAPDPDAALQPGAAEVPENADTDALETWILDGFQRNFTEEELSSLSAAELLLIRSGLYAVSGFACPQNAALQDFFSSFPWYSPNSPDENTVKGRFNSFQKYNTELTGTVAKTKLSIR